MKTSVVFLCCFLVICVPKCFSNRRRIFYLAFMKNLDDSRNSVLDILISGQNGTTIEIECASPYLNITEMVPSSGFLRIGMPTSVRLELYGLAMKGIRVTATDDVFIHGSNSRGYSTDAFVVIPANGYFTEFQIPSYTATTSIGLYSQFAVVGQEANTEVQVFQPIGDGTFTSYRNFSLNSMETFFFLTRSDYTGYKVFSSKPVSIFSGNNCGVVENPYCDHMAVGVLPVAELGTDFIVPPIAGRSTTIGYRVRIIANQDTNFTISDTSPLISSFLRAGQFYEYDYNTTSSTLVISCTEPCSVFQYNKGGENGTDPFMMTVVPKSKYTNALSWVTPTDHTIRPFVNYISIISKSSLYDRILLNGILISASVWFPVPGDSEYYFAYISINDGTHTLTLDGDSESQDAFVAYAYGHRSTSKTEAYGTEIGYQSNFFSNKSGQ